MHSFNSFVPTLYSKASPVLALKMPQTQSRPASIPCSWGKTLVFWLLFPPECFGLMHSVLNFKSLRPLFSLRSYLHSSRKPSIFNPSRVGPHSRLGLSLQWEPMWVACSGFCLLFLLEDEEGLVSFIPKHPVLCIFHRETSAAHTKKQERFTRATYI